MMMAFSTSLDNRGVLAIVGDERVGFLQGLLSNDIRKVSPERAQYALLLSAQGRFLHALSLAGPPKGFLADIEAERQDDLVRRLKAYRLRAKVEFADLSDRFVVVAAFGEGMPRRFGLAAEPGAARPFAGGVAYVDPRLPGLGVRLMLRRDDAATALTGLGLETRPFSEYDRMRLELGVPDGSRDLAVNQALPIECGLDGLGAIAFDKGCYIGQELTARTHHRGAIRRRLLPVRVDGPMPEPGTPVSLAGSEVGRLFSGRDGLALALLRVEAVDRARAESLPLNAATAVVKLGGRSRPIRPWADA
jgi:folate-binding protein YgfZ